MGPFSLSEYESYLTANADIFPTLGVEKHQHLSITLSTKSNNLFLPLDSPSSKKQNAATQRMMSTLHEEESNDEEDEVKVAGDKAAVTENGQANENVAVEEMTKLALSGDQSEYDSLQVHPSLSPFFS